MSDELLVCGCVEKCIGHNEQRRPDWNTGSTCESCLQRRAQWEDCRELVDQLKAELEQARKEIERFRAHQEKFGLRISVSKWNDRLAAAAQKALEEWRKDFEANEILLYGWTADEIKDALRQYQSALVDAPQERSRLNT